MEFRKATQEDLAFVRLNPFEEAIKGYPYMQIPDENCFVGIFESAIVGIGGLVKHWDGRATLWLMLTSECKKHGFYGVIAIEAIRGKMNELIEKNGIWRAEAAIRTDFPQAKKMIEYFGFKQGCLARKYFPDKSDAYLYSRVI